MLSVAVLLPVIRIYQNLNIAMEQSGVYTTFQILRRVLIFSASLTLIVFSNLGNLSARLLGEIFIAPFFYLFNLPINKNN